MHIPSLGPNADQYMIGAALLVVLFLGFFKLDALIGAPRNSGPRRAASGRDRRGRPIYSDPDGRPWKHRR